MVENDPTLLSALRKLVEPDAPRDLVSPLRWTCKSLGLNPFASGTPTTAYACTVLTLFERKIAMRSWITSAQECEHCIVAAAQGGRVKVSRRHEFSNYSVYI